MKTYWVGILLGMTMVLFIVFIQAKSSETSCLTCDSVECRAGTHCVMVKKYQVGHGHCAEGPACVNDTCSDNQVPCTCENGPNKLECETNEECVMGDVVCIEAPCPPIAMCVYKEPAGSCEARSCAVVFCAWETKCEVIDGCATCVPLSKKNSQMST